MLPFIRIFGRTLPMYGLLGVLGFLLGLLFILLRAPRFSLKRDDAVYIYVFAVLGALLGAKLVYILTVLPELLALIRSGAGVEELFGYLSGGLVFFGGVLGALPAAYLSARAYRVRFADFLPLLVPCIPLIGALGRVGCFCAGCCWGVESSSCLAVVFPEASLGAPSGVPLLPVQLFEAAAQLGRARTRALRRGVLYPLLFALPLRPGVLARGRGKGRVSGALHLPMAGHSGLFARIFMLFYTQKAQNARLIYVRRCAIMI